MNIGDEAELNQDSGPQTHLFEDRVMKMNAVVLGARSTLGPHSIALPGARLQDGARLGSLSLVMKGETIPEGPAWAGSSAKLSEAARVTPLPRAWRGEGLALLLLDGVPPPRRAEVTSVASHHAEVHRIAWPS